MEMFKDKVILITGGASGIGLETAKEFLEEGARVVITGRNQDKERGQEAIKTLKKFSSNIIFVTADVTLAQDCKKQVDETVKKFGKLDIVVACAGINAVDKLLESSEKAWDLVLDTNLKGVFLTIKAAAPELIKNKGNMVAIASDVALTGSATIPIYSISKTGVLMLVRLLANELAPQGVRINSVLPANIEPGMVYNLHENTPEGPKWIPEDSTGPDWVVPPIGRFGKASEVAKAILFLASDDASYCNGSYLLIDGALNAAQA